MAAPTPTSLPGDNTAAASDALHSRTEWFATTTDPWEAIGRLEFGGDRTHASTIERIVLDAEPEQRPVIEGRLIAVLGRKELTPAGRRFVCRMLGWIGSVACLPAVEPMLSDPLSSDDARLALDGIAGAAVTAAYCGALDRVSGPVRLGLIGSLARRRDAGAVAVLRALAADPTQETEAREAADAAAQQILAKE